MRKPMRSTLTVAALLGAGLLTGCGSNDDAAGEDAPGGAEESSSQSSEENSSDEDGDDSGGGHDHGSGDTGLTPEALAAVAIEHLDQQPDTAAESSESEHGVGVRLGFGKDSFSAHMLTVTVSAPEGADNDCSQQGENADGCEEIEVDGQQVYLTWEEEEPEEDPGVIVVWTQRDDAFVGTYYAGDEVNGDPREQDLSVDVDQMVDIVTDDRLKLDPSDDVLHLGEDLDLEWLDPH